MAAYRTIRHWQWTPAREHAAALVAANEVTDARIAAQCGVCRRTLGYWKAHPAFQARVQHHRETYARQLEAEWRARERAVARAEFAAWRARLARKYPLAFPRDV